MSKVALDIDLEKFRISLVGDGYLYEEVLKLSEIDLKNILQRRIDGYILTQYSKSCRVVADVVGCKE